MATLWRSTRRPERRLDSTLRNLNVKKPPGIPRPLPEQACSAAANEVDLNHHESRLPDGSTIAPVAFQMRGWSSNEA